MDGDSRDLPAPEPSASPRPRSPAPLDGSWRPYAVERQSAVMGASVDGRVPYFRVIVTPMRIYAFGR